MTIKISEIDGQYEIIIDDQVVHSAVNNSPSEWESVEVDIADTRGGDKPTAGQYQNFVYNLCYFSWENSALTDNGVITVSSNYATGMNKNKITDGLSTTYWHSRDPSPWMKFALNTPQTISKVTIGIRPGKYLNCRRFLITNLQDGTNGHRYNKMCVELTSNNGSNITMKCTSGPNGQPYLASNGKHIVVPFGSVNNIKSIRVSFNDGEPGQIQTLIVEGTSN